jgi:hypothetical protein
MKVEKLEVGFQEQAGRFTPFLSAAGVPWIHIREPVRVRTLGPETAATASYASVEALPPDKTGEGRWRASAHLETADGTTLEVLDTWCQNGGAGVQIDREVRVTTVGLARGLRIEFRATTVFPDVRHFEDLEFFIPGALYKRNDTNHDGVEDYLGTYVQDYRDDRLASLAVLAYAPRVGRYVALTRGDSPELDTPIRPPELLSRHFLQETDIGSLGLAPIDAMGQVCLRASYPFAEEFSYCLNTNRDGWAAYRPNQAGQVLRVSYRLHLGEAPSLTDAIWDLTRHQMGVLAAKPQKRAFTLEDSLEWRLMLTQQYYREWDKAENPAEPGGYLVHFSPRSGRTQGALLEYGFSGAQTLLAYTSLVYGYRKRVPLWTMRACRVIDFFVGHCQRENGFCYGMYDAAKQEHVYWFTGILMPFQYARDEAALQRYLGSQVTRALAPIAEKLRSIQGNYTRTMCEAIYPLLLAYRTEQEQGNRHDGWLHAGQKFGAFLLRAQGTEGSWHRAFDVEGRGLEEPVEWFGAGDTERKSGTIFPIPVLAELHKITGDRNYLEAAEKAARFIIQTYVEPVEYVGGLNDTTHIKSVKTDAVGVMFAMRSLLKVYEATQNPFYLEGAVKAAKVLASWVYLWNVPFPAGSLLATCRFKTTGWAGCDVIPGGSYLDNEFLEFTGDLVKVAEHSGERGLFDIAEIVAFGMQHALSTPAEMMGYVAPGIQCEGIMTAYWMSDPDVTGFSGAVNKSKGDDNDTCNGLTNGQAAYATFELLENYGTLDFDALRQRLFTK